MTGERILVIDDDTVVREQLRVFFEANGFRVDATGTCASAEELCRAALPDVAVASYQLPDGNGIQLMKRLAQADASIPMVLLSEHGSVDLAVAAVKEGAEHFLTQPVDLLALLVIVRRVFERQRRRRREAVSQSRAQRDAVNPFLGTSAACAELAASARRLLGSDSPVLIQGETGSGKGVLARWLHANGPRAGEPFVDLNCAGLVRELLEDELFGHERGAFTGAATAKQGLLDTANRGTLFLDEIGDMDLAVQPKLLKVVEEQRFRRLGDVRDREIDVRLITATHLGLSEMVKERRFRADLFYRINTLPLVIQPLRKRRQDIPVLARHLLGRIGTETGRGGITVDGGAMAVLASYSWPGNVRELKNVLERAALLTDKNVLGPQELSFLQAASVPPPRSLDTSLTLLDLEKMYIERVLAEENGKVDAAARRLGIPRSSLYEKIKRYDLHRARTPIDGLGEA